MAWVTLGKSPALSGPRFSNRKKGGMDGEHRGVDAGQALSPLVACIVRSLDRSPTFQPSQHLHLCWRAAAPVRPGAGRGQAMLATRHQGTHFPQSWRPEREPLCFPLVPGQWVPCQGGSSGEELRKEAFNKFEEGMWSPGNSLLGSQHLGESGVRWGGRQDSLAAELPPNTQTFRRLRVCLCVGGTARASMGNGHRPLRSPPLGGATHPDSIPAWVGRGGGRGGDSAQRSRGSAWDSEEKVGFPEDLGDWAGGVRAHRGPQPSTPVASRTAGVSGGPTLGEC